MEPSILLAVKKNLGLAADYDVFDAEIVTHINAALATLHQLGVGPATGFAIEDDLSKWEDFLSLTVDRTLLSNVKTYIYLRVRLLFDPPSTSYALKSFQDQIREIEWRLNVEREHTAWVDPLPPPVVVENPYA